MNRIVMLEGASNFRDLGGIAVGTAHQVRTGRLYRSDALYGLTDQDLRALVALGLRHIIDLRRPEELERYGSTRLIEFGAQHINLPMFDLPGTDVSDMVELYLGLLQSNAQSVQRVFRHLVENPEPTVVHCFAGKDRTGLTVALILSAIGVAEEEIATDYAISETNMTRLLELRGLVPDSETPLNWLEAKAETMFGVLEGVNRRWGSAAGYLEESGVDASALEILKRDLVVGLQEHV